ncbi:hypothetical protein GCM10010384_57520 [Streptomyces djakartensis]|uniref:Uncharacterized protein n=1 Tax=Streptomyces djakartensis TaxID=68193 RepID=A0ABQ3AAL1_9ACTN|nr:hypothetical protein GCM10010384_57520 [Streptomyces djakartensis]
MMPEEAGAWSGWVRWGITGFSLLMTGLMGGIIGGLAFVLIGPINQVAEHIPGTAAD